MVQVFYRSTEGLPEPPGEVIGPYWAIGEKRRQAKGGGAATPCGLPPLSPMAHVGPIFPRGVPVTPRYSGKIPESVGTISMSEYNLPIYGSSPLNHSETPHHVLISSGTPNKLRSPKHITHNTNHHRTLSVRTLRVRELCRHDRDKPPVNYQ